MRPSSGSRLLGVEGLRAIGATGLVVWHTYVWASKDGHPDLGFFSTYGIPHLQLTLWIFFCLSGFLLYRPFAAALLRGTPRPSFAAYGENRLLRIVPAYWFILTAVTFVLGVAIVRTADGPYGPDLPTFLADLALVQTYHPSGVLTGIAPVWSLCVEVVFYAVLPLLVLLAAWCVRRVPAGRARVLACYAPAALLLGLGIAAKRIGQHFLAVPEDPFGFRGTWFAVWERSFLSQADLFAWGMALAVLHVLMSDGRLRMPGHAQAGLLGAAVAIAVPLVVVNERGHVGYGDYSSLMGLVSGLLVAGCVLLPGARAARNPLVRVLESAPFRLTGTISYSIFLWHYPVVSLLREHGLTSTSDAGFALNVLTVVVVTWILSALTYRYIERPFLRRKRRTRGVAERASAVAVAPAAAAG